MKITSKTFELQKKDLRERIKFHSERVDKIKSDWPDYFNTPRDVYSDYCYSMDEIEYLKAQLRQLGVKV